MFHHVENPRLVNILTASPKELEPLREQVHPTGLINMLMHAFYMEDSQENAEYPRIPGYEEERDKIIQANSENLVFCEEVRLVRSIRRRISEITTPPKQVFICTTESERADPEKPNLSSRLGRQIASILIGRDTVRQNHWDKLANILKRLGVETIALGGQYLTYFDAQICKDPVVSDHIQEFLEKLSHAGNGKLQTPDETGATRLIPIKCVGWAAQNLALRGFNVSLTLPSSPREILETTP